MTRELDTLVGFLKVTADETRLRLLRLLRHESLNVGELVRILGLAQSSVSRQLGALRKAGFVTERREAGFSYFELAADVDDDLAFVMDRLEEASDAAGDLARLTELRRERSEGHDRVGRMLEPGRSWAAWAHALRFVLPSLRVADFGCGDAALTVEMAGWARHVVGIDRDKGALARAAKRVARLKLDNVRFEHLELESFAARAAFDLVFISHTLHYAAEPESLLATAATALAPGGRVIVFELATHDEQWVKDKLGHVRLGFGRPALVSLLEGAGFSDVVVERAPGKAALEPFES